MTPGPRGWVIDSFRDARLAVTDEEWELLSLVATHGRISISQLVPAQLACLRSLGESSSADPRIPAIGGVAAPSLGCWGYLGE